MTSANLTGSQTQEPARAEVIQPQNTGESIKSEPENKYLVLGREEVEQSKLDRKVQLQTKLKEERASGPKQGDSALDIKVDHQEEVLLIPKSIVNDDTHIIGNILCVLATSLGYSVISYDSERYSVNEPTKEVRDFFLGFLLGTDDEINLKLDPKRTGVELGRTVCHALRVRGRFRSDPILGIGALRGNQIFFGNRPEVDKKTKLIKEKTMLESMLKSYLDNEKDVHSCMRCMVSLLEKGNLENYSPKVRSKAVADNLVTMTEIQDHHRRIPKGDTRPKKRDSKKAVEGKLPEKPSTATLLTKDELEQINSYFSPLWASLQPASVGWVDYVYKMSYSSAKDNIDLIFRKRWECLEALASVTTRRLREVKTSQGDSKITKRKITADDFSVWLSKRPNRELAWLGELASITKPLSTLEISKAKSIYGDLTTAVNRARDLQGKAAKAKSDMVEYQAAEAMKGSKGTSTNVFSSLDNGMTRLREQLKTLKAKDIADVILTVKGKSSKFRMPKDHLFRIWVDVCGSGCSGFTPIEIGELTDELFDKEIARSVIGPNSILGKMLNTYFSEGRVKIYTERAIGLSNNENQIIVFEDTDSGEDSSPLTDQF